MTVIQRLTKIAKPFTRDLYIGIIFTFISTVIETGIVSALAAAMINQVTQMAQAANVPPPPSPLTDSPIKQNWLVQRFNDLITRADQYVAHILPHKGPQEILIILAVLTALSVLLKCAFGARASYLMNRFSNLMALEIRQKLFSHLVNLPPAYFEKESTGSQLSRITNDVVVLQSCMGPQLLSIIQAPLTIGISLVIMVAVSWHLMIMLLVLMPFFVGINHVAGRRIRQLSITMQERLGDLNGSLVERLTNIRVVQSFVRQGFEEQNVAHLNHRYYRETMRSVFVTETLSPTVELIAWIGMVAGIILAGNEVRTHQINLGSFMLFVLVAQKAGSQFKMLSRVNQLRQQTTGAGERIFDTLDIVPEIQNAPRAIVLPPVHGQVQFSQVNFHYRTGAEILHAIDVQVAPGEVIALVGPSGSGKTTLVNLLPRFYDPTAGSIRIDGQDLRDITLESLREQIGIVPQETLLFSGSIYENILYGRLTATEAEVIAAARSANALEFIERLPDGFQTVVGERGARLSGGQRQRVAIARALLKDPKILILDEATSALDTESEHLVQQALDRLMENRTTFVIAHRLSTVKGATRLLVLEHGRIVESGTHQELLELGGLYSRLYEMQFRPGTESLESV